MSLSSFVAQQELTGTLILNFRTNLKKTGREKLTVPAYENRLTLLDSYWRKFSDRHENVVTFSGYQDSDYMKEDYFAKVEDAYVDVRSYIQEQITQMSKRAEPSTVHAETPSPTTAAKLPKFILPVFTGDFLEWESFKDLFLSSVHENKGFSDATRLQYLLAQVSGDAAELIRDIKITDQNYAPAWEILSRRYDNQRLLVKHHFRHLLSLSPLTTESADSLRKLLDKTNRTRRALQNLGRPVAGWDDWFVHLTVDRLPARTHRDWESAMGNKATVPSWEDLNDFIVGRIHSLEAVLPDAGSKATPSNTTSRRKVRANFAKITSPKSSGTVCSLCNEQHYIGYCPAFKKQSLQKRRETAVRLNLCTNCLREHPVSQCASARHCTFCQERHHSLLHQNDTTPNAEVRSPAISSLSTSLQQNHTLLATALVKIHGFNGRSAVVRALLDQGSEATFLSENVAQQLRLPRVKVTVPVLGIGSSPCGTVKSTVRVRLTPILEDSDTAVITNAYILPNLSESFHPRRVDARRWNHLNGLQLSDTSSQRSTKIDLVLGADIYGYTLLDGLVKGPPGTPVAQRTIFGWVLSGITENPSPGELLRPVNTLYCSLDLSLSNELRRFWEIEEIPNSKTLLTPDDEFCERHYQTTHYRDVDGRFVVRLPRRSDVPLGDSKLLALRSFHKGELQRRRDPALGLAYRNFMDEYIRLGHMKRITEEIPPTDTFYLPHHAVWKREGDKNKIRVVFNASAPTDSGYSLNDALLSGPKLQQDLGHIILRWRKYAVVFSADIVKMFRQIQVDPADQPLQRVFWRDSPAEELQEYQLQTVTYGTACAPFLAIRTLLQLATEGYHHLPKASSCLRQQTYVDDILTGTDTLDEARELKRQLEELLMAGGFELAKWASNSEEFAPNSRENHILSDGTVKTLGLHWNPIKDVFGFQVQLENPSKISKRSILSSISRLFDPLGWLAPVVVKAKILLQDLWSLKIDWDAALPKEQEEFWIQYYASLQQLQEIQIPRWIHTSTNSTCELHGFCDASQRAYAASVYLRTEAADGTVQTHLLVAKTKVAPLKVVSLPRLELSGAVLLSRLLQNVYEALQLPTPPRTHAWTDSQVVLHWISAVPARWKCFVANRVSEIHQTLPHTIWRHVKSSDNPADPASRGLPVADIKHHFLWWHGPPWLSQPPEAWPVSTIRPFSPEALEEANPQIQSFHALASGTWNVLERYSRLTRLIRVTSWIFRFVNNLRTPKSLRRLTPLSVLELERSRQFWVRFVQHQQFAEEIHLLRERKALPKRSVLHTLRPFLDSQNLLRVGGRLENAPLSYDEKHPIILSASSNFTRLLVTDSHCRTLHGGPQLTLAHLSSRYWILGGRNLVKNIIRKCIVCFRYARCGNGKPPMGQLPTSRVTPSRPFTHCGLDYAGPLTLRSSKGRSRAFLKGYVALFVCMSTRAIHLEAVSDYSTAAFLAAFKRFVSRRGIPATLCSDQATTFKGADAELKSLFTQASAENKELADLLATDGTQWNFIPPHSPHFGGIWEAGVKSVKGHLKRVLGNTRLTFEELSTVLTEIEACLNSRPISPISSSPQDLVPLTPGHFLIGSAPKTLPEPSLSSTPINRLSRWQLLRRLYEDFWRRWSREYLHHLQQRQKWTTTFDNLEPDDLVLIQEDNLPPAKWRLGRIVAVHPGADGIVRVVTVRTATSTFRRAAAKVRRLPLKGATEA